MASLAGRWTLKAIAKEAGWIQGISIVGSLSHDGIYEMDVGTTIEHIEGDAITITLMAFNPAPGFWVESLEREVYQWDDAVGMTLTLSADDNPPGDLDFNDLVVACTCERGDMASPHAGVPRPDLTIPEQLLRG